MIEKKLHGHVKTALRDHADKLGFGKKPTLNADDWDKMRQSCKDEGDQDLVIYLDNLINEQEFEDLVVNVIYG
jgi:hypothetical protein